MHVDLDICIRVDDAFGANADHSIDDILQERLVRLAQGGRPGDLAKGLGVRLSSDQISEIR